MGYSAEQKRVAEAIARQGKKYGANRTQLLAAYNAALTEASLKNPNYGDRDSVGAFQQRSSWGSRGQRTNPDYAAAMFFKTAKGIKGKMYPGQLAQAVQRSAFPARYAQHTKEAADLIAQFAGGRSATKASVPSRFKTVTKTVTTSPAVDNSATRSSLKYNYLSQRNKPGALLDLASGLQGAQDVPAKTKQVSLQTPVSSQQKAAGGTSAKGVVNWGGKPVAGWIAPILTYARAHGWKGSVNSGYRSYAKQAQIYNSGVRPAAKPGQSNHNYTDFPRGAVDVSDAQTLASIIAKSPYRGKLVWAGSKDPVHFSHPQGGRY